MAGRPDGGVMHPGEARAPLRLEPGAPGGLVAVEAPGPRRAAPALGLAYDSVVACREVEPGTAGLCSRGGCLRCQDKAPPADASQAGAMHATTTAGEA